MKRRAELLQNHKETKALHCIIQRRGCVVLHTEIIIYYFDLLVFRSELRRSYRIDTCLCR